MCPLTSKWDCAAASTSPCEGLADMSTYLYIKSWNSVLCWSGPTRCVNYLMILESDVEGTGEAIRLSTTFLHLCNSEQLK